MSGKTKTAYFYSPTFVDGAGVRTNAPAGFWSSLHTRVESMTRDDRSFTHYGRAYRGIARQSASPAQAYFYLGKVRTGADMPDATTAPGLDDADVLSIAGDLLEPLYVRTVGGSAEDIVMLRTTGGPSASALEGWVSHVMGFLTTDITFELVPLLRPDAVDKLQRAVGATKFDVKIDPDQAGHADYGNSALGRAVETITAELGGFATIGMDVSFGNGLPPEGLLRTLAHEAAALVRGGGLKRARATLLMEEEDGSLSRDKVDFIRDRVTAQVSVGSDPEERPTAEVVLHALADAVRQYRSQRSRN